MNTGFVNGTAVDGAAPTPSWFARATAAATAAALIVAAPGAIKYAAAAAGNASASGVVATAVRVVNPIVAGAAYASVQPTGTVTPTLDYKASSLGAGSAAAALSPSVQRAASAQTDATAIGLAAVLRQVQASASADAVASGVAIPAAVLGDAQDNASATVVDCVAHLVVPGKSSTIGSATVMQANCTAVRMTTIVDSAAASGFAETTIRRSGDSFFQHEGYVRSALATATASIDTSHAAIIATFGSLNFGESTASAEAYAVVYSRATEASAAAAAVVPIRIAQGSIISTAGVAATVNATRAKLAAAAGSGAASIGLISPAIKHRAAVYAICTVSVNSAKGKRTAWGQSTNIASASGNTSGVIVRYADAGGSSAAVGNAEGFSNAEVMAPADRTMTAQAEDRVMFVAFEDRTMIVRD